MRGHEMLSAGRQALSLPNTHGSPKRNICYTLAAFHLTIAAGSRKLITRKGPARLPGVLPTDAEIIKEEVVCARFFHRLASAWFAA
jgi:hypothetical protein